MHAVQRFSQSGKSGQFKSIAFLACDCTRICDYSGGSRRPAMILEDSIEPQTFQLSKLIKLLKVCWVDYRVGYGRLRPTNLTLKRIVDSLDCIAP